MGGWQAFLDTIVTSLEQGQIPLLGHWTYLVLAILIVIEGPIVTLLAGAAAATGVLHLPLVVLVGSVGNLSTDVSWYLIGRAGKVRWLDRLVRPKRRPALAQQIEAYQEALERDVARLVLLAKLSKGLVVPAMLAVGLGRIRWKRWLPAVLLGELIWTGGLAVLGYFAAAYVRQVSETVRILAAVLAVIGITIMGFLLRRAVRRHNLLLRDR